MSPNQRNHTNECRDDANCNCPPLQQNQTPQVPTLTPISRMFLMIAGAMFGLFLLKYVGAATS
jgi:hypothetical protein